MKTEKDYSQILQTILGKFSDKVIEMVYKTSMDINPKAREVLDKVFESYPVEIGKDTPKDAFLLLCNNLIEVSLSCGIVLGMNEDREDVRTLIKEFQEEYKEGLSEIALSGKVDVKGLLKEIPGSGIEDAQWKRKV